MRSPVDKQGLGNPKGPGTSVRIVDCNEGGGAGGVDAVAGALQPKGVRHPPALIRRAVACTAVIFTRVYTWADDTDYGVPKSLHRRQDGASQVLSFVSYLCSTGSNVLL